MDLYVQKGLSEKEAARALAKLLKAAGVDRVSVIRGQVNIAGKKAIEFHDIERLLTNIRQVTPTFSDPRSYIIKTPEGIQIQRIGLQANRKLIAAFADPKRFATGKYVKDLLTIFFVFIITASATIPVFKEVLDDVRDTTSLSRNYKNKEDC